MGLFDYKHNKKDVFKNNLTNDVLGRSPEFVIPPETIPEEDFTNEKIINLISGLTEIFASKNFKLNSSFDSDLINDVKIFTTNLNEIVPEFSGYFSGIEGTNDFNVSGSVLIDSILFLKDSLFSDYPELELLKESNLLKIGSKEYTVTDTGLIYKNNQLVFDIKSSEFSKINQIDFKNKNIVFFPGIVIPFHILFTDESNVGSASEFIIKSNTENENDDKESYATLADSKLYEALILSNNNLSDKKVDVIVFSSGDLNFSDLSVFLDTSDASENVSKYLVSPNSMQNSSEVASYENCISNKINFMYLLLLIILGGGKEGTSPIPWKGQNAYNDNCDREAYNNWHPMLWSSSSKKGIPFSILQYYFFCLSPFFGINIDEWIVKICIRIRIFRKKIEKCWSWTIFRGWCICGHLEKSILNYQSKISDEIRRMFSCNKVYYKPIYLNEKFIVQQTTNPTSSTVFKKNLSELNNEEIQTLISEQGSIITAIQNF